MKKTAVTFLAIIAAITLLFTGCNKDKDNNLMNDSTSTTKPVTTSQAQSTTKTPATDNAGAPESTSQNSALGDAIGDVADGVGDVAEDIGDAAERAGDRIAGTTKITDR